MPPSISCKSTLLNNTAAVGNKPLVVQAGGYQPGDIYVLTAEHTAQKLGLSKITLIRMRQRADCGGLPFVRLSQHRIGYLSSDVDAFLAARRVGKLPEAA